MGLLYKKLIFSHGLGENRIVILNHNLIIIIIENDLDQTRFREPRTELFGEVSS